MTLYHSLSVRGYREVDCTFMGPNRRTVQEHKDVGVVTEDSDSVGAFCRPVQHEAAEGDVCLIMGNNTVQLVDQLNVVWKGIFA